VHLEDVLEVVCHLVFLVNLPEVLTKVREPQRRELYLVGDVIEQEESAEGCGKELMGVKSADQDFM
jgi:hypothetical protein